MEGSVPAADKDMSRNLGNSHLVTKVVADASEQLEQHEADRMTWTAPSQRTTKISVYRP